MVRQFKGVENFLKRIAFNLGNTPSQTEVKIISCIPIDVSDLQQKILCLEKQLDDKYCPASKEDKFCPALKDPCPYMGKPQKTICGCPPQANTGVCCNMLDVERGTNPDESCNCCRGSGRGGKSNVSFVDCSYSDRDEDYCDPPPSRPCHCEARYVEVKPLKFLPGDTNSKNRKCNLRKKKKFQNKKKLKSHFVYYAQTNTSSPFNKYKAADLPKKNKASTHSYISEMLSKQYKPIALGENSSEISKFSSPICRDILNDTMNSIFESDSCSCDYKTFQNIDNEIVKHNKVFKANQMVTGGYYDSTLYDVIPVKDMPVKSKKTNDTAKKREPKPVIDIKCPLEDERKFMPNPVQYVHYYTMTPATDNYMKMSPKINRRKLTVQNTSKRKVEADKRTKVEISKNSHNKTETIIPGMINNTHNTGSKDSGTANSRVTNNTPTAGCTESNTVNPKVMNNTPTADKCAEGVIPKIDAECVTKGIIHSECQTIMNNVPLTEKTEITLTQIKDILQSVLQEVKITALTKGSLEEKPKKNLIKKKVSQCGLPNTLETNIAAGTQNSVQGNVPINMAKNYPAGVQAGIQNSIVSNIQGTCPGKISLPCGLQGNMARFASPCSYNANPHLPSCSKQLNIVQPFHAFPVFLQPPIPHMCTGCFQHSPQPIRRNANTAATNTVKQERSKETRHLIKEIYKTMALNMGVGPPANNTLNKYKGTHDIPKHLHISTKGDITNLQPVNEVKKPTNVVQAVSELFRHNELVSSVTPNTTTESRQRFNSENATPEPVLSSIENLRKERLEKFLSQVKPDRLDRDRQEKRHLRDQESYDPVSTYSENISTSATESDIMFESQHRKRKGRKDKRSLLYKMLNTVNLFKPRNNKRRDSNEKVETPELDVSSSDSGDYQTICSQKINITPKRTFKNQHILKQIYQRDKSPDNLMRNSPYMEQEYRRHWNEKLMFDDNKCKNSSDVTISGRVFVKSPYNQTFETRTSFVEPKTMHKAYPINARLGFEKQEKHQSSKIAPRQIIRNGISFFKKSKMSPISSS